MNRKGIIFVISGFSGVGKGTAVKRLLEKYDHFALSVSMTTRAPREGEVDGIHYFFVSEEEFKELDREGKLMESAGFVGSHYGTPEGYVRERLEEGKDVILEIESQGAFQIKGKYPESVLIFMLPPSAETLKNRLEGRGTETPEKIQARLQKAVQESKIVGNYDYIVVNDDLESCVEEIHNIVVAEHASLAVRENRNLVKNMEKDLKGFVEGE